MIVNRLTKLVFNPTWEPLGFESTRKEFRGRLENFSSRPENSPGFQVDLKAKWVFRPA